MAWLTLRIKPPVVMLILMGVMWGVAVLLPHLVMPMSELRWWIAGILIAISLLLCFGGIVTFFKAKTTIHPDLKHATTELVTHGLYRITRNPMYLGMFTLLIAMSWVFNNRAALLVAPVFVVYMNQFQIKPEEAFLVEMFGEEYKAYCRRVRRWL